MRLQVSKSQISGQVGDCGWGMDRRERERELQLFFLILFYLSFKLHIYIFSLFHDFLELKKTSICKSRDINLDGHPKN